MPVAERTSKLKPRRREMLRVNNSPIRHVFSFFSQASTAKLCVQILIIESQYHGASFELQRRDH